MTRRVMDFKPTVILPSVNLLDRIDTSLEKVEPIKEENKIAVKNILWLVLAAAVVYILLIYGIGWIIVISDIVANTLYHMQDHVINGALNINS